jgi:hypothetical protein
MPIFASGFRRSSHALPPQAFRRVALAMPTVTPPWRTGADWSGDDSWGESSSAWASPRDRSPRRVAPRGSASQTVGWPKASPQQPHSPPTAALLAAAKARPRTVALPKTPPSPVLAEAPDEEDGGVFGNDIREEDQGGMAPVAEEEERGDTTAEVDHGDSWWASRKWTDEDRGGWGGSWWTGGGDTAPTSRGPDHAQPIAPRVGGTAPSSSRVPDYVQPSAPRGGIRVHFAELIVATIHGPHQRIRDGSAVVEMAQQMATSPSVEGYVHDVLRRCGY